MMKRTIPYEGKFYTLTGLADKLGESRSTVGMRIKNYGLEEAIRISHMDTKEYKEWLLSHHYNKPNGPTSEKRKFNKHEHEGKFYTSRDLAEKLGVSKGTFSSWVSRHGLEHAIAHAKLTAEERKSIATSNRTQSMRTCKSGSKFKDYPLPEVDPDFEIKNQAASLIERFGMEEAMIKASLI